MSSQSDSGVTLSSSQRKRRNRKAAAAAATALVTHSNTLPRDQDQPQRLSAPSPAAAARPPPSPASSAPSPLTHTPNNIPPPDRIASLNVLPAAPPRSALPLRQTDPIPLPTAPACASRPHIERAPVAGLVAAASAGNANAAALPSTHPTKAAPRPLPPSMEDVVDEMVLPSDNEIMSPPSIAEHLDAITTSLSTPVCYFEHPLSRMMNYLLLQAAHEFTSRPAAPPSSASSQSDRVRQASPLPPYITLKLARRGSLVSCEPVAVRFEASLLPDVSGLARMAGDTETAAHSSSSSSSSSPAANLDDVGLVTATISAGPHIGDCPVVRMYDSQGACDRASQSTVPPPVRPWARLSHRWSFKLALLASIPDTDPRLLRAGPLVYCLDSDFVVSIDTSSDYASTMYVGLLNDGTEVGVRVFQTESARGLAEREQLITARLASAAYVPRIYSRIDSCLDDTSDESSGGPSTGTDAWSRVRAHTRSQLFGFVMSLPELSLEELVMLCGWTRNFEARSRELTYDLLCAVDTLHSHEVLCGDLRPTSVMIDAYDSILIWNLGRASVFDRDRAISVCSRVCDEDKYFTTAVEDAALEVYESAISLAAHAARIASRFHGTLRGEIFSRLWTLERDYLFKFDSMLVGSLVFYLMTGGVHAFKNVTCLPSDRLAEFQPHPEDAKAMYFTMATSVTSAADGHAVHEGLTFNALAEAAAARDGNTTFDARNRWTSSAEQQLEAFRRCDPQWHEHVDVSSEAQNFVCWMLTDNAEVRPTLEHALTHPLTWCDEDHLDFLLGVTHYLAQGEPFEDLDNMCVGWMCSPPVEETDWSRLVAPCVLEYARRAECAHFQRTSGILILAALLINYDARLDPQGDVARLLASYSPATRRNSISTTTTTTTTTTTSSTADPSLPVVMNLAALAYFRREFPWLLVQVWWCVNRSSEWHAKLEALFPAMVV